MESPKVKRPKKQTQLSFSIPGVKRGKQAIEHGGEELAKLRIRKTARPFEPSMDMHITMRAKQAVGERSMLHPRRIKIIKAIVVRAANRHKIELKRYVCVGNHCHFLIKTKNTKYFVAKASLQAFLREVAGVIARVMTGAKKGVASPVGKFWDHLAWSRVVHYGKDLFGVMKYIEKNKRDAWYVLRRNGWLPWFSLAMLPSTPTDPP